MRPHRLVVRGFRSFADEASIDFTDRSLVGVVGPIGSGKSTLLDAIAFALYGQTPTVGKQTKSLINQRQDSAHVELWFGVADETWRAVRALRRKGQSAHTLEQYSAVDGDRSVTIEGEKAVNAKMAELLGLDFHAFGRSVLLAQNQFARFLDATGGERDAVLKGVFGLDRIEAVRDLAKTRRDAASRDLQELERRRTEIEADRAALAVAKDELAPALQRDTEFEDAVALNSKIDESERAAAEAASAAETALAGLKEMARELPSRTDTAALFSAVAADAEAVAKAAAAVDTAEEDSAKARSELEQVTGAGGSAEQLARLEAEAARVADLASAVAAGAAEVAAVERAHTKNAADVEKSRKALEAATTTAAEAATAAEAQAKVVTACERALHAARHADMAASLRSGLEVGDSCPVCGSAVSELEEGAGSTVDTAEKDLTQAVDKASALQAARTEAQMALTDLTAASAAAAARLEEGEVSSKARAAAVAELSQQHDGAVMALAETVGKGDPMKLIQQRWAELRQAEKTADAAAQRAAEMAKEIVALRSTATERQAALHSLAAEVAKLGGSLGAALPEGADGETLSLALDRLREAWETKAAAAEDALKEATRRLETTRLDRTHLLKDLGVETGMDFASARVASSAALATAKEKVAMLEERVGRVAELEKENAATLQLLATYTRISDDLAPSKFLAFLLDEERVALAELAAERFEMLSGGRYRFSEDGSFDIVDLTAADAVRKSRSLSGGETFLASLALALALAEMVTRSGGRLSSFFLDEGFGSLDPEHLDLAMEGVERIVAGDGDRLVVVVSHVPELRQRLEDVIELDKHPITGDTVVVHA